MVTTPVVAPATFTDLLGLLFPTGTDGYLKVVAEGSQRPTEAWFRRSPAGAWLWQRSYGYKEAPTTVEEFLAANPADLFFSPLAWSSPALGIPGSPTAAVWTSLRIGTFGPTARTVTVPRIDAADAERVRQRLAELSPLPSVVINEGDRLSGIWLLTEPLPDLAQLERALRGLTARLSAGYVPPQEALVGVPGTRNTRLLPAPTVEIVTWEPGRRYALDALALT